MLSLIRSYLSEPRLQNVDVDSSDLIEVHRQILREKPMLLDVFREFYDCCMTLDARHFTGAGSRIEIGAGVSMFKTFYPDVISTDIKPAPHLDRTLDALEMDLPDRSVRAFFGINCFHHFPDPEKFFREISRTLVPGGGCVLIDPYYGPLSQVFYKNLFKTEHFDPDARGWTTEGTGVMNGANQALSYIVFERDKERFASLFPQLEVCHRQRLPSSMRYVLSGGLNFKSLLSERWNAWVKRLEAQLEPTRLAHVVALHHIVVIRRRMTENAP